MPSDAPAPLQPLPHHDAALELRKPSWKDGIQEIVGPAGPVGRIDSASWSGKARAESVEGRWDFSRTKGFRRPRIEITAADDGAEVATFAPHSWRRGGLLELDGREYELHAKSSWSATTWTWKDGDRSLVAVERAGSLGKRKGRVTVTDEGRAEGHATLLALIAVHVFLANDGGAAAVGATVAVGATTS
jgi:hypothetical protein